MIREEAATLITNFDIAQSALTALVALAALKAIKEGHNNPKSVAREALKQLGVK